jgi:ABC-type enterobactin transport system permease subunit
MPDPSISSRIMPIVLPLLVAESGQRAPRNGIVLAGIAIGAVAVAVGLFLIAPEDLRTAIVASYLGLDQTQATGKIDLPVAP